MKCPKCGYNSFDYLDSCKKCGKDLVEFKQRFGIKSILFPGAAKTLAEVAEEEDFSAAEAAGLSAAAATAATGAGAVRAVTSGEAMDDSSSGGDDFGFDFMGESTEEEDLSFDELFEEAPEEEDVEESLEGPRTEASAQAVGEDDFAFELPDSEEELEDDFGFDPEVVAEEDKRKEGKSAQTATGKGPGEGPSSPFDLPESSAVMEAPDASISGASAVAIASAATLVVTAAPTAVSRPLVESPGSEATEEIDFAVSGTALPAAIDESVQEAFSPAALTGRCASFIYDAVVLALICLCFVVAAEVSMSKNSGPLPTVETLIDLSVPYFLVLFSLTFGYFTLFHFLAGQTPGKMLTGLRVETTAGEPLVFSQAFLRSVGGLLQFLPFGLGYLLILFRSDQRGWNDRLAGTRVVVVSAKGRQG